MPFIYYGRSTFQLSEADKTYFKRLSIDTLYVKFFDVVWHSDSNAAEPVAVTQFLTPFLHNIEIIPTIFITNATIRYSEKSAIDRLAKNILTDSLYSKGVYHLYSMVSRKRCQRACILK